MAEEPREARQRHLRYRHAVHDHVARKFSARSMRFDGLSIGPINASALRAWRDVWGGSGFDWDAISRAFRKRYARFEAAIWSKGDLCGLAMGRVSPARTEVSVNFIQGAPHEHALRGDILRITVEVAVMLGKFYGSNIVRFTEPIPRVQQMLAPLGFTYVARRHGLLYPFCERSI